MATIWTHPPGGGPGSEVRVCSDSNNNDCVVVGRVGFEPVNNYWTTTPANAQGLGETYATEDDAQLALIKYEYEYWQKEARSAETTLPLLAEVLKPGN